MDVGINFRQRSVRPLAARWRVATIPYPAGYLYFDARDISDDNIVACWGIDANRDATASAWSSATGFLVLPYVGAVYQLRYGLLLGQRQTGEPVFGQQNVLIDLARPPGAIKWLGQVVNQQRLVAGYAADRNGWLACVWNEHNFVKTLQYPNGYEGQFEAYGISPRGLAVGWCKSTAGYYFVPCMARLPSDNALSIIDVTSLRRGKNEADKGWAHAVNSNDDVVGMAGDYIRNELDPAVPFILEGGHRLKRLHTPHLNIYPTGINDSGIIVGNRFTTVAGVKSRLGFWFDHASGDYLDINEHPDIKAAGWNVDTVSAINNNGTMLCQGALRGVASNLVIFTQ